MGKNGEWCVELNLKTGGWRYMRANARQAEILTAEAGEAQAVQKQCRIRVNLVFSPDQLYLMSDEFSDARSELLDLELDQAFTDRGLAIDGGNFVHRSKKLRPVGTGRGLYQALFISEDNLEALYGLAASWRWIRSLRIIPDIVAIAGLVRTVTPDPVLVLHLEEQTSQIFGVRQGVPLYHQPIAHTGDEGPDPNLIPHAVEFAYQSLKREHDIDRCRLVIMGKNRSLLDGESLGLQVDDLRFTDKSMPDDRETILRYPQLFGAPHADPDYDFTPPLFYRSWRLQCFSRLLTGMAFLGAIACFAGWYILQDDLRQLRQKQGALRQSVTTERQALLNVLPDNETFGYFERMASIREHASRDHRLDTLVNNIARAIPQEVRISQLEVKREEKNATTGPLVPPPAPQGIAAPPGIAPGLTTLPPVPQRELDISPPETLQTRPLVINLIFQTKGNYAATRARFDATIAALTRLYTLDDISRNYREDESAGVLRCTLRPKLTENK